MGPSDSFFGDGLKLADDLPDEGPCVKRYVGIVRKVVEDVDGAGGTYVGGVLGVEKPSLCIGGSLPDVSGDGSVLGEHGHCVNNLFDFVCHFVTAFQASSNSS